MAQNENAVNVRQLTRNAQGNWVLDSMPGWSGVLEITFREAYRLDSIPLAWTVTVSGVDRSAQVTAYTADEGPDTLGWLNVLEGDTVELVPPTAVKPTVKNVELVNTDVPSIGTALLSVPASWQGNYDDLTADFMPADFVDFSSLSDDEIRTLASPDASVNVRIIYGFTSDGRIKILYYPYGSDEGMLYHSYQSPGSIYNDIDENTKYYYTTSGQ